MACGTLKTHGDPIGTDAGGATSPVRHWSNRTSRGRYFGSEIPARPNGYVLRFQRRMSQEWIANASSVCTAVSNAPSTPPISRMVSLPFLSDNSRACPASMLQLSVEASLRSQSTHNNARAFSVVQVEFPMMATPGMSSVAMPLPLIPKASRTPGSARISSRFALRTRPPPGT